MGFTEVLLIDSFDKEKTSLTYWIEVEKKELTTVAMFTIIGM